MINIFHSRENKHVKRCSVLVYLIATFLFAFPSIHYGQLSITASADLVYGEATVIDHINDLKIENNFQPSIGYSLNTTLSYKKKWVKLSSGLTFTGLYFTPHEKSIFKNSLSTQKRWLVMFLSIPMGLEIQPKINWPSFGFNLLPSLLAQRNLQTFNLDETPFALGYECFLNQSISKRLGLSIGFTSYDLLSSENDILEWNYYWGSIGLKYILWTQKGKS